MRKFSGYANAICQSTCLEWIGLHAGAFCELREERSIDKSTV